MADANMAAARSRGDALLIPKPRRRSLDLTQVRRDRLEAIVEHLIWLLDAWDGDDDREGAGTDDDRCVAHDDDPGWSGGHGHWLPGDPDDAEPCEDLEASAQPAVTPDSAPRAKQRACLCCTAAFLSDGPHHRLCRRCRNSLR